MVSLPVRPSNGALYGRFLDSGTGRALTKVQDPAALANLLYRSQYANVVTFFDDFNQVTMNGDPWTKTKDAGATDFAVLLGSNGLVTGITGTTSGEGLSLFGPKVYSGLRNAGIEARFRITGAITAVTVEMGFIDAITDKTTPACTDPDVPTFGAGLAEAAVWTWDTAETIATPRVATKGATSSVLAKTLTTPYDGYVLNTGTATAGYVPVVDNFYTVRVQLINPTDEAGNPGTISSVECTVFDSNDPKKIKVLSQKTIDAIAGAEVLGGVTAATTLAPWFAIATSNTTSKAMDIDYVSIWQDR